MLIATYQERPVGDKNAVYPKIKGIDHPVFWAFPIPNVIDGIAESIITAANVPKYLCVYDIDPSCFIRIDTRKRTELIAEDKFSRDDAITPLINSSLSDRYSELLVDVEALKKETPIDVCNVYLMAQEMYVRADGSWNRSKINQLGLDDISCLMNRVTAVSGSSEDLNDLMHELMQKMPYMDLSNMPVSGNISNDAYSREVFHMLQAAKVRFEYIALPFLIRLWFGYVSGDKRKAFSSEDMLPVMANFYNVVKASNSFSEWADCDGSPDGFDAHYDALRNTIVDDKNVIDALYYGKKPQRNDPCPCGSGRKWKHCHGAKLRGDTYE